MGQLDRKTLDAALASIETHVLTGEDAGDLRSEVSAARAALEINGTLTFDPVALDGILKRARERREQADRERSDDFRRILSTLNEAFHRLSSGRDQQDTKWKQLEASLRLASRSEDMRTLKQQLSELITYVQRESEQEHKQGAEALDSLSARVRAAHETASRFGTTLAGKEDALALLRKTLTRPQHPARKTYFAMFAVDTAAALRSRHGHQVANGLLEELTRERVKTCLSESDTFRWSPESILAIWESNRELPEMAGHVASSVKEPFEYRAFVGTRVASFSVTYRTVVYRAEGPLDDIVLSLNRFAKGV